MAGKERPNQIVHRLINEERKRRGLPWARWNQEMYLLAKDQANQMAKEGRLFHSNMATLTSIQAAENCWMGKGIGDRELPKSILGGWMKSTAGHRENLLSDRIGSQGIAISKSRHGTFAVWQGSLEHDFEKIQLPEVRLPDLSKVFSRLRGFFKPKAHSKKGGDGMLRLPAKLILICASVFSIVLGAHGVWVYFSRLELLFGGEASRLFLALEVPVRLGTAIEWMSFKGLQSWFIPALFIVLGLVIWHWQNKIDAGNVSGWLRKLKLW